MRRPVLSSFWRRAYGLLAGAACVAAAMAAPVRQATDAAAGAPAPLPFLTPWLLAALPLALLPLLRRAPKAVAFSSLALLPADRWSSVLEWSLRTLACVAIAAALLGMAGPFRPAYEVERVGRGAEIVLLLDRSLSMDQPFITAESIRYRPGTDLHSYYRSIHRERPSKQLTARRLLAEFAAQRRDDRFAMFAFSTLPIPVLEFTGRQEAVQAAIRAGEHGRGLAETDIGMALRAAIAEFQGRPYSGSRIVMLISDGGDRIDADTRLVISQQLRELRVSLYWLYIRSLHSPGLSDPPAGGAHSEETAPEYYLHRYFESLGTPYRVYEAESPEALKQAIAEVSRLESTPITYRDTVPRRELAPWAYGVALACTVLLLVARALELRRWR